MKISTKFLLALAFALPFTEAAAQDCPRNVVSEAVAAEDNGNIELAIRLHKKAFEESPGCYRSANAIAGLYGVSHDFENEIIWAKRSLEIVPTYLQGYINLGNGYVGTGRAKEAMNAYITAGKLDPNSPLPPYSAGALTEVLANTGSDRERQKALMEFAATLNRLNRPVFTRHLRAVHYGRDGGGYEWQALLG